MTACTYKNNEPAKKKKYSMELITHETRKALQQIGKGL